MKYSYDIFISYFHKDEAKIRPIYDKMTDLGLEVFWSPKRLEQGVSFPREIGKAVLASHHFLVFWGKETASSEWVSKESEMFLSNCHLRDKKNRRMYVLLENPNSQNDLPGLLKDLNRPKSSDDLIKELVKVILKSSKKGIEHIISNFEIKISQLEEQVEVEKRKVEDAQNYYRYSRFWGPISLNRDVHIFTCARDIPQESKSSRGYGGRTNIDMWDYRAVLDITHFFASNYPNAKVTIQDPMSKLHENNLQDPVSLANRISNLRSLLADKDCIIIGSPDVSDFAELVLAEIHEIRPYTDERIKKKGFVLIKEQKTTRSSFYWVKDEEKEEKEGAAKILGPETLDYFPNNKIVKNGGKGKMYGILVVAKNPFSNTGKNRKIIILSGFSGVATNAISKILTDEKCLHEFFKLDTAYGDGTRNIEALIGVEYITDRNFENRDTRKISGKGAGITFENLVEI